MAIPQSITNYLEQHHVPYSVIKHPWASSAQKEAAVAHVPGREWAKTVVCIADGRPVFAVLPATHHVDVERLRATLDARTIRLAEEAEMQPIYSDCELGAMPPFGELYNHQVVVDESLTADSEIAFNAGSHSDAIRMAYRDFETLVKPTVADFGRQDQ